MTREHDPLDDPHADSWPGDGDWKYAMITKRKKMTRTICTPQQLRCWDAMSYVVGGDHHLPRNVYECGHGIQASFTGEASTFDGSMLTRLVLVAHADAVRFAISGSGPNRFLLTAHPRQHDSTCCMSRHPTLADLIQMATGFPTPTKQSTEAT